MMLLVPSDVLRPRRPDEHFAAEAAAARAAGAEVALVDHDALAAGGRAAEAVRRVPEGAGPAVYRGWMLRAERYAEFAAALAARGVALRTGPEQYRRGHELPGWYAGLAEVTPRSAWTEGFGRDAFDRARTELGPGPAVLRDWTKSMKHYWDEACYVPDAADGAAAWAVAARFLELRDEERTGGFVLRRFETFGGCEVRTWWVDGVCRLVGPHPDTPDARVPCFFDPEPFAPLVAGLELPCVTLDLALREDGVWRVVELGDAGVSDRPASTAPETLIAALGVV